MVERLLYSNGTQSAAPDPQNDKGLKVSAHSVSSGQDISDDFILVVGQFRPAKPAGSSVFLHRVISGSGAGG